MNSIFPSFVIRLIRRRGCLFLFNVLNVLAVLNVLSVFQASAQQDSLAKDSLKKNNYISPVFSLDSRSTFIDREHITINGALGGIEFGEKHHKITLGYYWLKYGDSQKLIDFRKKLSESINLSSYIKTDVFFFSMAYWFPVIYNKKWQFYVPVELGLGKETANYQRLFDDNALGKSNSLFLPCQLGVYGEFHATKWVGVFSQLGYRNTLSSISFRKRFEGVYYSYGLTFYPDAIFVLLKRKKGK